MPLLWVLLDDDGQPRTRHPFFYGMVTGIVANGGGFYWIVGLLQRFGHLPWIVAAPLFLLLVAYQALTFGLFAVIVSRLRMHIGVKVTWLAPLVWVACELCVPYVFPWYLAITQAWVPTVIQVADITGPLGVSFLLVLSNGALFDVLHALGRAKSGRRLRAFLGTPLAAVGTIVLSLGYGTVRIHQVDVQRQSAEKLRVGVVQANVGIHEKFVPGLREQQHALHLSLSQELTAKGAELILWPESSYPYPLLRPVSGDFPERDARKVQRGFQTPIVFGALTAQRGSDGDLEVFNTAVMFDKDGKTAGTFDKNFLLIFGEYLPFAHELSSNLRGVDLGTAVAEVRKLVQENPLGTDIRLGFGGQSEELDSSIKSLLFAFGLAMFLVYLVMASQFESLLHPFVIMFSVPLAIVGAVAALWLSGSPVSVVVFIGLILLVGIVVKNAIVLIDKVNQLREEGVAKREAICLGAESRLRPIIMTTLTTLFGFAPLAFFGGDGAEVRAPMAITVIGGLTVSTLLTLVVIPIMYNLLDRRPDSHYRERGRLAGAAEGAHA